MEFPKSIVIWNQVNHRFSIYENMGRYPVKRVDNFILAMLSFRIKCHQIKSLEDPYDISVKKVEFKVTTLTL